MKALFFAAILACAPTVAEATVTINFAGQTYPSTGTTDSGGSYTSVTENGTKITTAQTASQAVSGKIVIDTAAIGPNGGTAPNVYYQGSGFSSFDFTSTGFVPLKLSGLTPLEIIGSTVEQGYTFFLLSDDQSYSYIFSIFTIDGDIPTAMFDGVLLPDFAAATNLLFAVQSSQVAGGVTTEINSLGFVTSITQAVPEPATWALMIVGFGLVGGSLRRRSRTLVHA